MNNTNSENTLDFKHNGGQIDTPKLINVYLATNNHVGFITNTNNYGIRNALGWMAGKATQNYIILNWLDKKRIRTFHQKQSVSY